MLPTHSSIYAWQSRSLRGPVAQRSARWSTIWILSALPACAEPSFPPSPATVDAFITLESPIGIRHTCLGAGVSPALRWAPHSLPKEVTHLAWVMSDKSGVVWSAWDASVDSGGVREQFPAAHSPPLQGTNHLGRTGWAPPCPSQTAPSQPSPSESVRLDMFAFAEATHIPPTELPKRLLERLRSGALIQSFTELPVPSAL